jgi:hypothetical protein
MSLLGSISKIWHDSTALCGKVPFDRVYVGRGPGTQKYPMPSVFILASMGVMTHRTDKTRYSHGPVTFHVWVDDADLENGEAIAQAITDEYAERSWRIDDNAKVYDVLDGGEATAIQTDMASVKAWEVVKLLMMCVERNRVDRSEECGDDASLVTETLGSGT